MCYRVVGARHGRNDAAVTDHLVACTLLGTRPAELVVIARTLCPQARRGCGRSHIARCVTCEADGTLLAFLAQGAVNIAANPQVAAGIHEGLPHTETAGTLEDGVELAQHLAALPVESSYEADIVHLRVILPVAVVAL